MNYPSKLFQTTLQSENKENKLFHISQEPVDQCNIPSDRSVGIMMDYGLDSQG
jgi:hypothetical protein